MVTEVVEHSNYSKQFVALCKKTLLFVMLAFAHLELKIYKDLQLGVFETLLSKDYEIQG